MKNKKFFILFSFVLILFIFIYFFFYFNKNKDDKNFLLNNQNNFNQIDLKSKIINLVDLLENKILNTSIKDSSLILDFLNEYKKGLEDYIAILDNSNIKDKNLLKEIRILEWQNYRTFLLVKERFKDNSLILNNLNEINQKLDNHIKNKTIKTLSFFVFNPKKEKSSNFLNYFNSVFSFVYAQFEPNNLSGTVIHKKAIIDPEFLQYEKFGCWGYEAWIDFETKNMRQEQKYSMTENNQRFCITEIDITEGATGRKLALNPERKLAEWLGPNSGKIGIGSDSDKDPYTKFKEDLESGYYEIFKTDEFEGKKVYLLRHFVTESSYVLVYLNAENYLPVRDLTLSRIDESLDLNSNFMRIDNFKVDFAIKYVVAEIINREDLPSNFFDLTIPEDYKLEEWVPRG